VKAAQFFRGITVNFHNDKAVFIMPENLSFLNEPKSHPPNFLVELSRRVV